MLRLQVPTVPKFRSLAWSLRAQSDLFWILMVGALVLVGATAAAPRGQPTTAAWQPGETPVPASGSGSESSVGILISRTAGAVPPRAPSSAEAQAPAADFTLAPNQDGWPNTNPLLVQVTLTCAAGGPHCTYPLTFKFYSNDGGRFWVYGRPDEPDCGCAEVVGNRARIATGATRPFRMASSLPPARNGCCNGTCGPSRPRSPQWSSRRRGTRRPSS